MAWRFLFLDSAFESKKIISVTSVSGQLLVSSSFSDLDMPGVRSVAYFVNWVCYILIFALLNLFL